MKARVTVTLKNGILDPQGKAIEGALKSLGVDGIASVRQGKVFDIELAGADKAKAEAALKAAADKLLHFAGDAEIGRGADDALAECEILVVLVDHDVFKSVPLEERSGKIVYDTRGLWPDQGWPTTAPAPRAVA